MNTDGSSVICDAEDIDSATLNFSSKLLTLIRVCILEKTVTIRPKDKPWFDSLLRRTVRKRDRLRNLPLKYKRQTDWIKFRNTRNQVNNMKKTHALSNYYDNIEFHLDEAFKDNDKLYWKLMKDTFKTKSSSDIPPIQHVSDKGEHFVAFSDLDEVELLNIFFSFAMTQVMCFRQCIHPVIINYQILLLMKKKLQTSFQICQPTKLLGLTILVTKC